MENIIITKINNNPQIDYLVFSTTIDSPFLQLDEIAHSIYKNRKLNVVVDQLLQTGDNDNRFVKIEIADRVNYNSAKIIKPNNDLSKIISCYLKEHKYLLKNSILMSDQKKLIEQGKII